MSTQVSEAVSRPVRTLTQAVPSLAITEFVDAFFYDMTDRQYAALAALLLIVFSFVQAAVENGIGKAFMRALPPYQTPVVDENGKHVR